MWHFSPTRNKERANGNATSSWDDHQQYRRYQVIITTDENSIEKVQYYLGSENVFLEAL